MYQNRYFDSYNNRRKYYPSGSYDRTNMFRAEKEKGKETMPYWAGYVVRSLITLFLLLSLYFFGISRCSQQQVLIHTIKENVCYNSNFEEAVKTYGSLDVHDLLFQLKKIVLSKTDATR